jgi:hypothetical protein
MVPMEVSVSEAKGQSTTQSVSADVQLTISERRMLLEAARCSGADKMNLNASAARSQDFLYDDEGLPR